MERSCKPQFRSRQLRWGRGRSDAAFFFVHKRLQRFLTNRNSTNMNTREACARPLGCGHIGVVSLLVHGSGSCSVFELSVKPVQADCIRCGCSPAFTPTTRLQVKWRCYNSNHRFGIAPSPQGECSLARGLNLSSWDGWPCRSHVPCAGTRFRRRRHAGPPILRRSWTYASQEMAPHRVRPGAAVAKSRSR